MENGNDSKNTQIISSWYDEESIISTEFRRLYSKLRHLNPNKELKNLLITSATLGEGKSTIAALLAVPFPNIAIQIHY